MQSRKTLAAALVFAALIAYIYFFEWNKEAVEKGEKLLNFTPDEAQTVALQGSAQEIRLQRDDSGRWKLTSPLQTRADDSAVASLLAALSGAQVTKTVVQKPTAEELKNFGLDQPSARVSVTLKSGVTLPGVLIGAQTPVGSSVYARRDVKPDILLTDSQLQVALGRKVNDFRNKRILEIKEDAVRQLTLKSAKGPLVLTKKGDQWLIDAPRSAPADAAEVGGLLNSLQNLLAQDFIEAKPADFGKYGLDRPRLQITINQNDQQVELSIGNPREGKGETFAAVDTSGTVYSIPTRALEDFDRDWQSFRDRRILAFAPAQAAKLQIQKGQESFALTKDAKEQWTLQPTPKGTARAQAIDAFVTSLGDLKAKAIAEEQPKDLKRYGLDPPSLKISVAGKDGEDLGTLLVGGRAQPDHYAQRAGRSTVYLIDEAAYKQIAKSPDDFLPAAEKTAVPGKTKK